MLTIVTAFVVIWVAPSRQPRVSADTTPTSMSGSPTSFTSPTLASSPTSSVSSTTSTSVYTPSHPLSDKVLTVSEMPTRWELWPKCSTPTQAYCYENLSAIDASGASVSVSTIMVEQNCHGNDRTSRAACDVRGGDWLELQIKGFESLVNPTTITFTVTIRTGSLEPTFLVMGDAQKTVVTGDSTAGHSITISVKPRVSAFKSMGCIGVDCDTAIADYLHTGISGIIQTRPGDANLKGAFVSSNGQGFTLNVASDRFDVRVMSPHYLPRQGSDDLKVAPGFVRFFLTTDYIVKNRGYASINDLTVDKLELTVKGDVEPPSITYRTDGVLIDTGITHFSAPDPSLRIKPVEKTASSAAAPTSLSKGSKVALSRFATPQSSTKPKWSAKGACKIVGKTVVATSSKGTCSLTLQTLNAKKKYVTTLRKTLKVS